MSNERPAQPAQKVELSAPAEMNIDNPKLWIRFPRDGKDANVLSSMDAKPVSLTDISHQVKRELSKRGIFRIEKDVPVYVDYAAGQADLPEELSLFLKDGMKAGFVVMGDLSPERNKQSYLNVFPTCEIAGERFRILRPGSEWEGKDPEEVANRLNDVFIPSRMVRVGERDFFLMPIIEKIDHPAAITQDEYEDFMSRLKGVRIRVDTDLDPPSEELEQEINLARFQGKLYLSDAGDVVGRAFVESLSSEELQKIAEPLQSRIRPAV